MKRFWGLALMVALVLVPLAVARPAYAAPAAPDSTLLLMDLSGSMADKDASGVVKIEGAKTGAIELLNTLPSSARVGLMTYPGAGGCTAPRLVREIQPLTQGNLGAQVSALASPDGGTPTADALKAAADTVRRSGGNATIVLVSDGMANCDKDPCPVAREIAASGVPITVNSLGFDIDAQGAAQLQCISDATGGSYEDVRDSSELGERIAQRMSPTLKIWAGYPSATVPVSSSGAVVHARIENTSGLTATNVRVSLTPQGGDAYAGILRPVMALGNIPGGESRDVSWTVPVSPTLSGKEVRLRITASALNSALAYADGIIHFGDGPLIGPNSQFVDMKKVAVLGDSFSSGDGAHFWDHEYREHPIWGQKCRQSSLAYAEQLFPGRVDNFACTGAQTKDIRTESQHGYVTRQKFQLANALRRGERYDAVFLTIGGNDAAFAEVVKFCITNQLVAQLGTPSFLNSCMIDPGSDLYEIQTTLTNAIAGDVRLSYEEIAETFSRQGLVVPPIIVSPYPMMTPSDPGLRFTCGLINLGVNQGRMEQFRNYQRQVNRVIEETVKQTREESGVPVYFASDVEFALQPSHTICAGTQSWVNLPRVDNAGPVQVARDTPFHPHAGGYAAWALALARWSETPGLELQKATKMPGGGWAPEILKTAPRGSINGDASRNITTAGTVDLRITGLQPGSTVIIIVRSSPVALGHTTVDEEGRAELEVFLDERLIPPGAHTLQLAVVEADGTETVRHSQLYVMRPVPYVYLVALGLGLVLLGVGVVLRWRSRPR